MEVSLLLIALLALLVFGLGFWVSAGRGATQTNIGSKTDPRDPLYQRVRAHANAAEYAPMMALLIYLIGTRDPGVWLILLMSAGVLSRYLHAAGMLFGPSLAEPHPLRFAGALGTYLTGALMVAVIAWWGIVPLFL